VTALSNEFTDPQASTWREELRRIQAPALLIAGGPASHVDQGQLADMAALIPDCELVTIPAGHLVHAIQPAGFTAAVTSFLGTRGKCRLPAPQGQHSSRHADDRKAGHRRQPR
jgi:3-oxoadipate enol-lactonase